jgi:hypothetical protein
MPVRHLWNVFKTFRIGVTGLSSQRIILCSVDYLFWLYKEVIQEAECRLQDKEDNALSWTAEDLLAGIEAAS